MYLRTYVYHNTSVEIGEQLCYQLPAVPPCGTRELNLSPKCLYLPSEPTYPGPGLFCFKKKYKVETEIENWIQKYDMEMNEKQVRAGVPS